VRLAYILSTFPCGSEVFAVREIAALQKQGFAIVVLAAVGEDVPAFLHAPSRVVYRPRLFSLETLHGILHVFIRHPAGMLRLLRLLIALLIESPREARTVAGNLHTVGAFARAFDREELRHVHAYFLSWPACIGLALAAVTGASLSIAAHARDVFVEPGALRLKASRAKFITTCTRQAARHLKSRLPAICHARLFLCYHGVEVPRDSQRVPGGKSLKSNNEYTLACVGRLVPKKGHADLVRAMALVTARLPRCRLVMVGSGPEQQRVRYLVNQLGLSGCVELRGWQAPDVARDFIETADVLVVPSAVAPDGDRDGIPNVILEAFAAGTPVVATRLEGITEAVEHGYNGIVVEQGDIVGMARAIEEVLGNCRLRTALSRAAGKTLAQRFDIGENTRQLAELFQRSCTTV